MPVFISYAVQLLLVVHVLKTGRDRYWIWLLLFVPFIGPAAYLVIEVIPEFTSGIRGQRTMRNVKKAVNPEAGLQKHAAAWEQSPNADNARRYAEALLHHGQYSQAGDILEKALSGFFSTEPGLLLLKANLAFETGDHQKASEVLEFIQQENPDFRSAEGHLLYARALEAGGRVEKAVEEYRGVSSYFPGVEARYRMALAMKAGGNPSDARHEFEQLLNDAELAPTHFRKSQKKWLGLSKDQLEKLAN
jgi:hypothetical protein